MDKIYKSMGLMSGTSLDGVDVSIIESDGNREYSTIFDRYFEYDAELVKKIEKIRDKISNSKDLQKYSEEIKDLEKEITLFHAEAALETIEILKSNVDLIGFHGQTIFHNVKEKVSKQIGDGYLLSQLTKCPVVYRFRQLDLENNGQGAPLTPVFHYLISQKINNKFKISYPINFINIGGITNVTCILDNNEIKKDIFAYDIAPGNCLIDQWLRKKSNKRFDDNGSIAKSGKINELILNQAIENFEISSINQSLDVNDFDIGFVKGLNLEDGCATITEFTAYLISEGLKKIDNINNIDTKNFILCGGGRKNKTLIKKVFQYLKINDLNTKDIDEFNINGDFVEAQAFGYLAIRSFLNLPISFPNTTRCVKPCSGGELTKNF